MENTAGEKEKWASVEKRWRKREFFFSFDINRSRISIEVFCVCKCSVVSHTKTIREKMSLSTQNNRVLFIGWRFICFMSFDTRANSAFSLCIQAFYIRRCTQAYVHTNWALLFDWILDKQKKISTTTKSSKMRSEQTAKKKMSAHWRFVCKISFIWPYT